MKISLIHTCMAACMYVHRERVREREREIVFTNMHDIFTYILVQTGEYD